MANSEFLQQAWRRAMDLNIRYYSAIGRLAADYLKDLVSTIGELSTSPSAPAAEPNHAHQPPPQPSAATMVLEAEASGNAIGVFLVHNHLDNVVSAKVVPSAFIDDAGHEIHPKLNFEPDTIQLGPHEQILVRVTAAIDRALKAAVSYRGELNIPELAGTRIPVVVRRRPGQGRRSRAVKK
jgi:hypothetical protein